MRWDRTTYERERRLALEALRAMRMFARQEWGFQFMPRRRRNLLRALAVLRRNYYLMAPSGS
jgi:hypothetical protein